MQQEEGFDSTFGIEAESLLCQGHKKASFLCSSSHCKEVAFICSDITCKCQMKIHLDCSFTNLQRTIERIRLNKKNVPEEIKKTHSALRKVYDEAILQLSDQRDKLQLNIELFGLEKSQIEFIELLQTKKTDQIKGKLISKIFQQFTQSGQNKRITFVQETILSFWRSNKKRLDDLCDDLGSFSQKSQPLVSTILTSQQDIDTLNILMSRGNKNYKLLYRASENSFSVARYHTKCDGKKNTLVLIKTETNKIVGGYTNLQWDSSGDFKLDQSMQTFIFSISLKQKYLLSGKDQNAILCHKNYGPTFGGEYKQSSEQESSLGSNQDHHYRSSNFQMHDLCIPNNANTNEATFYCPYSYKAARDLGQAIAEESDKIKIVGFGLQKNTSKSSTKPLNNSWSKKTDRQNNHLTFCGVRRGSKVKIQEWQVFEVQ